MPITRLDDAAIQTVTYPKGQVLFRQGDRGGSAYIVNAGAVGMYREADDRKIPLATVRKGELFGEMAVIDDSPRLATAFTLEESSLTVISIAALSDKIKKSDPFIKALLTMLMQNLRGVHDSYTPKSRTLLDSVTSLQKQGALVTRFTQTTIAPELKQQLDAKLQEFDGVIKDLRRIAMTHRSQDRREDAIPNESDLPA